MNNLGNYVDLCKRWHDSVLLTLNDYQKLEYERVFRFVLSTRNQLDEVTKRGNYRDKHKNKLQIYVSISSLIISLIIGFFDSFDALSIKLIFLNVVISVVLLESIAVILNEISINSILVIERDLNSFGVDIFVVNEWIKNINFQEKIASDNSTEEERWKSKFETLITEFQIRNKILQPLTNYECTKSFPPMP